VIERYTRPEMGAVWTAQRRMEGWLRVELAATEAWAAEGAVPSDAAKACTERASFTVEAVEERERDTGHDVAAFVDVVAASVGPEGRWIHYGLTSSDVLDTALALQLREAGELILAGARDYRDALIGRALEHRETLSAGRTHGVHAEPTTSAFDWRASPSRRTGTCGASSARSRGYGWASSLAPSAPTHPCRPPSSAA
jgi:adenylosuccinate lyase